MATLRVSKSKLLILSFLLILLSCTTQEEIQRAQMVDTMSEQLVQNQKISAESSIEVQQLKDQLTELSGKLELLEHNTNRKNEESQNSLQERLNLVEEKNKQIDQEVTSLREEQTKLLKKVDEQSKFIKTVLGSLKKLSKNPAAKTPKSLYDRAMKDYRKGRYKKAQKKLLILFDNPKIKGTKRANIIHNLGMISYIGHKNNKALFYFSKLFTEYPKSSFNKNGLFHLARTFERMKKKTEATQTFNELIKRFPKSKMAKKARKIVK